MRAKINNPHDKFVKEMLSDKEMVTAFLEAYLPLPLRKHLDLNSLEYSQTHFMTPELEETFSDLVLKVRRSEKPGDACFISILLENKASQDKFVSVQILSYLANAYLQQLKQGARLHPVIPVIYYHGQLKWKLLTLSELMVDFPSDLRDYIPNYAPVFIDLYRLSESEIEKLRHGMLKSALWLQRWRNEPQKLVEYFMRVMENLDPYLSKNFSTTLIVYILQVSAMKETQILEIIQKSKPAMKNKVMSTYDMIAQRCIQEGIEKGIEKIVMQGYSKGVGLDLLIEITGLTEEKVREIIAKNRAENG